MLPLLQTRRQLYYKHGEESLRGLGGRGGAKESQNGAAAQASQLVIFSLLRIAPVQSGLTMRSRPLFGNPR